MSFSALRRGVNAALRAGMRAVAPLTHFIPVRVRRKVVNRLETFMERNANRRVQASAWVPGKYPFGANLLGHLSTPIGLGRGARLYAKALRMTDVPNCAVDLLLPDGSNSARSELEFPLARAPEYEINIVHINPDQLRYEFEQTPGRFWKGRYNIGVWAWELDQLPGDWLPWMRCFNEFWAPSNFVRDTIQKYTEKPVFTVPYGIEIEEAEYGREHFGFAQEDFLVLAMYDTQSRAERKNPDGAIQAFLRAFGTEHPHAKLVVKMNNPNAAEIERIRGKLPGDCCVLMPKRMERGEVTSLIAAADVFVSLHRSEGFGLVIAEAMAQRVPVVTTAYSASTDFVDERCGCPVKYRLVDVNGRYIYDQRDAQWAEPDVADAAEYLKRLYLDPDYRRRIGEAGYARIAGAFSLQKCAERMNRRLLEIQTASERSRT